jgi:hypothetical protein
VGTLLPEAKNPTFRSCEDLLCTDPRHLVTPVGREPLPSRGRRQQSTHAPSGGDHK